DHEAGGAEELLTAERAYQLKAHRHRLAQRRYRHRQGGRVSEIERCRQVGDGETFQLGEQRRRPDECRQRDHVDCTEHLGDLGLPRELSGAPTLELSGCDVTTTSERSEDRVADPVAAEQVTIGYPELVQEDGAERLEAHRPTRKLYTVDGQTGSRQCAVDGAVHRRVDAVNVQPP